MRRHTIENTPVCLPSGFGIANVRALLSMCTPYCMLAYSLAIPFSPMNYFPFLLIDPSAAGVNILKRGKRGRGKHTCSQGIFHLVTSSLNDSAAGPNCGN